jgi:hypothetical protein
MLSHLVNAFCLQWSSEKTIFPLRLIHRGDDLDKIESRWNIKHLNISKDKVIFSHKSGAPGSLHQILYFGWCKNLKTKILCLYTFNFMKKAWLYYLLFLSTVYKKDNQEIWSMCVKFGVRTDEVYCAFISVWCLRFKDLLLKAVGIGTLLCNKHTVPKIQFLYSQKRNCVASFPVPTFMCLWAIYIYSQDRSTYCIWLQQNRQTDPRKYKSPTDIWV